MILRALSRFALLSQSLPLVAGFAQESYQDKPTTLAAEQMSVLHAYEARAKSTLDHFAAEFAEPDDRRFYLVTRIMGDNTFEQVYVLINARVEERYHGTIDSEPMGPVPFERDQPISLGVEDVVDWVILHPDGQEEGNLQGKAIDLLQAGIAVFVCCMHPVDGLFAEFTVETVRNPQTRQEISDIVPAEVLAQVQDYAEGKYRGQTAEDDEDKFSFVLTRFPSWEIFEPEN